MKFFFLRHTSLNVDSDVFYGQTDLDVSDSYDSELEIIRKKIIVEKIDLNKIKVFSSPLKRCLKLARSISDNVIIDDRLKELNLGDWEMKKMCSISKKEIEKWEKNLLTYKIPNGESNEDFLKRLRSFLDYTIKLQEDLIIVAHAGSINGMISNLTNEPFDKLVENYWEKISYGSLSLIKRDKKENEIIYIGK